MIASPGFFLRPSVGRLPRCKHFEPTEMSFDLRTSYLGLELLNPLVASASPLTGNMECLWQMQEAGVAAVVMPSLFEEQLERDELAVHRFFDLGVDQFVDTLAKLPELDHYNSGPANYLAEIKRAKKCFRSL